jgi:Ca-activated chloride channel family protein
MSASPQAVAEAKLALLLHKRPVGASASRAFVLCRVTNDATPDAEARPVRLVVALDRSGSMNGAKLRHAQATLSALVGELGPEDRFALVTFDDVVEVAVAPTAMTTSAKAVVRAAIPGVHARGATDLSAAVLRCLSLAREDGRGPWHVILLTDGAPTAGVTNDDQILTLAGGALGEHTLSTFGYGDDVRSELLGRISDLGKGQYHFVQGGEAPVAAFASELGRQRALHGVEVGLRLSPGRGVSITAVPRFAKARAGEGGATELDLGPLVAGDALSLVIGVGLGPEAHALDAASPWLRARLTYRTVADGVLRSSEATLVPLLADVEGPFVAEVARALVAQRAAELIHGAPGKAIEEVRKEQQALARFAGEAGVEGDAEVAGALALVAQTVEGLAEAASRGHAASQAASVARGIYHREVTSVGGHSYARPRTMVTASRLTTSMAGPPPPPPKKDPEGD